MIPALAADDRDERTLASCPQSGTSGATYRLAPTLTRSDTRSLSASGRQTLSSHAEKTAKPWAPSRSNSFSKYVRSRSRSLRRPPSARA